MTLVSAIVCTYNGSETIENCIQSLLEQSFDEPYEIIVVDDGSVDDTLERVTQFDSTRVQVVEHGSNRGLSAARNTGWQTATGAFVAYIDDDAVAPPDWLQSLYERYSEDVAAVGGYSSPIGTHPIGRYEVARTEVLYGPNAEDIDGPGGMNMSFRKSVLAEIGGFDERFTHIGDDADIDRRLNERGYDVRVDPTIRVGHQYSETVADFARKRFRRGLGRATMHAKYGDENVALLLFSAFVTPFLLPNAIYRAWQCQRRTDRSDFGWFVLLAYLERVLESWGTLYYLYR